MKKVPGNFQVFFGIFCVF